MEVVVTTVVEQKVFNVTVSTGGGGGGGQGPRGYNGWSPMIRTISDGERRVQEVYDWTGGQSVKPAVTGYIGATGLVQDIALATDVRGDKGQDGEQGPPGNDGAPGIQGEQGIPGIQGEQGIQGIQGEQGEQGIQGERGETGANGSDGADGEDGESAYQIWLDNGNTGSEQDFLDSLVGPAGTTDYNDLQNKPTLGTAAEADSSDFATSSQGALSDTALQPADAADVAESGKVVKYSNIGAVNTVEPQFPENAVPLGYFDAGMSTKVDRSAPLALTLVSAPRALTANDQGIERVLGITGDFAITVPTSAQEPGLMQGSFITGYNVATDAIEFVPAPGVNILSADGHLRVLPNYKFELVKLISADNLWVLTSLGLAE